MNISEDILGFKYGRRFGVEIELNSFDGRDFRRAPLIGNELPKGIHYVGGLIADFLKERVEINRWHSTHNNCSWVIKPDSSCGMEICSPVSQGWYSLKQICKVVDIISGNDRVIVSDNCAFHVHVEVKDLNDLQVATILAYWIKCEPVFLDSVPFFRKRNRFCQCIGQHPSISHDRVPLPGELIGFLSDKYYTINTYQMITKGFRRTLEFRIIGHEGCLDSYLVKNWIKLIMHFVERSKDLPYPEQYRKGDPWSGLLWLDLMDVMKILNFTGAHLSKGMEQTRDWFLARLRRNLLSPAKGIWSQESRQVSIGQLEELIKSLGLNWNEMEKFLSPSDKNEWYSDECRI